MRRRVPSIAPCPRRRLTEAAREGSQGPRRARSPDLPRSPADDGPLLRVPSIYPSPRRRRLAAAGKGSRTWDRGHHRRISLACSPADPPRPPFTADDGPLPSRPHTFTNRLPSPRLRCFRVLTRRFLAALGLRVPVLHRQTPNSTGSASARCR